jgi:hypothetical protein
MFDAVLDNIFPVMPGANLVAAAIPARSASAAGVAASNLAPTLVPPVKKAGAIAPVISEAPDIIGFASSSA